MSALIAAAKRMALRFPGGVAALAPMCGLNANTLYHKLDPQGHPDHHLRAVELEMMVAMARDADPAHELAMLANHVCIAVPASAIGGDPMMARACAQASKEFADVMRATLKAIADNKVTARELADYDKQFRELLGACMALRAQLAGRVGTKAPPFVAKPE